MDEFKPLPGGNHFRCDPVTGSWPLWALRLRQGLTLVHFSAQRKHNMWDTLGA